MRTDRKHYVISAGTDLPFAEAVNRTRDLLEEAGYGVLCEIDVKAKPGGFVAHLLHRY
jgi:uncharacterized protein (DUF302 family)